MSVTVAGNYWPGSRQGPGIAQGRDQLPRVPQKARHRALSAGRRCPVARCRFRKCKRETDSPGSHTGIREAPAFVLTGRENARRHRVSRGCLRRGAPTDGGHRERSSRKPLHTDNATPSRLFPQAANLPSVEKPRNGAEGEPYKRVACFIPSSPPAVAAAFLAFELRHLHQTGIPPQAGSFEPVSPVGIGDDDARTVRGLRGPAGHAKLLRCGGPECHASHRAGVHCIVDLRVFAFRQPSIPRSMTELAAESPRSCVAFRRARMRSGQPFSMTTSVIFRSDSAPTERHRGGSACSIARTEP